MLFYPEITLRKIAFFSVWVLVFSVPWENMIMVPGIGTISRAVGFPVVGIVVFATLYTQQIRWHPMHSVMLVFGAWASLSYFWSVHPEYSERAIFSFIQLFIMVWMIFQWATKARDVHILMSAYVSGCWVAAIGTIYSYTINVTVVYQRYAALGFDANDIAVIMALGMAMSWYLSLKARNKFLVVLLKAYPVVALFTVILTASRTGFIVAVFALVFMAWTYIKLVKNKVAVLVVAIILLAIAPSYVPIESLGRIQTISTEISTSRLSGRTEIWDAGLLILSDASFWGLDSFWGKGMGTFPFAVSPFFGGIQRASHNVFLSVLIELGSIGLLLFALMYALALRIAIQLPKLERILWLVLLMQWAAAAMTLSWLLYKGTWLLLGLLVAHASAIQHDEKSNKRYSDFKI